MIITIKKIVGTAIARQSVKEGNSNENVPSSFDGKWNVYNGNLSDREASRELTMLYKRRMEEERSKGEFVPYRTYFRCSRFNIKE